MEAPVQIRVAEAEDAEPRWPSLPGGGGSCSEDESGRGGDGGFGGSKSSENDGDDSSPAWKPPEHDLILKLVAQVEYYFSDDNLEKDAFLLKHIRRNKMGYISVKLLTSFKKIKQLTRDWRTTAYALKYSDLLEMNEDNRKVRRSAPVPVFPSENLPSRMLLVYDISPTQDPQPLQDDGQENGEAREEVMEHVLKTFISFGVILSVRILKPGRDLPPDVKKFSGRYSPVGTQECAIVEFEEVEAAVKAHESFGLLDKAAMKVILIGTKPPKKKALKEKNQGKGSAKDPTKSRSMNRRVEELQDVSEDLSANSSSDPESDPTSPVPRRSGFSNRLTPSAYPNHHLSPNISPRSSPWNSPSSLRKTSRMSPLAEDGRAFLSPSSPETSKRSADYSSDSSITPSSSPWVQRRRQARTLAQEKSPVGSPETKVVKIAAPAGLPVGVLRWPRGPDGTKGFHNSHERRNVARVV